MKKLLFSFFFVLFVLGVLATPSFAKEGSVNTKDSLIEKQIKDFEKFDKALQSGEAQVYADKNDGEIALKATTGRYPTRKGTILVTDGLRFDSLVGHAGMVLSPKKTVESFPKGGVQYRYDKWYRRYKKVWGITTRGTSASKDAAAADWANLQIGKPYNKNFFNIETTSKFYCSQLVYKAVKTKAGVNLNWLGGIVTPSDLVNSSKSYTVYRYAR
ncbi:YiiX/YebB-like N1pC/P60 family cysteine hydrolase [Paraliobacillus sp. JSM ZJ581]|uniref:YiiX/YebB-like N1pC/P60 family cysteine hydrolase n=1 Tax=Paraliobacillus sp. JSM ZJ581 TaxID=3342118 RepID=UPI0035A93C61